MTPDPEYLFMTKVYREALLGIFNAIERRKGLVVLTGDAGTGKTILVRKVMASMPAAKAKFSLVQNPARAQDQFIESMLMDFGVTEIRRGEEPRLALLRQVLLQLHAEGKAAVLVVEEAHKLSAEQMEEIRLLTSLEVPEAKLLQVILVGQNELEGLLDQVQPLKQRVVVRLTLGPLSPLELEGYVEYRWCKAGGKTKHPFEEDALRGITRYSHGFPGLVNVICDNALLIARADGSASVGEKHVLEAAKDLQLCPAAASEGASGQVVSPAAARVEGRELPPTPDAHWTNIPTPERVGLSLVEGKEDRRGLPERRRASRSQVPELFVYYWTGGVSPPHRVLDVSEIGACFETKDRWPAGTIMEMTLQRMLGADGSPADPDTSLRVVCKVVRSSPGRLGVMFIYKRRQEILRVRKFLALLVAA